MNDQPSDLVPLAGAEESVVSLDEVLTQRRDVSRDIVNVDEPTCKVVIFALHDAAGEQYFAFTGERIREILAETAVFFVPGCPASLAGVINVRGDIESVIRLDQLLRIATPAGDTGHAAAAILLGQTAELRSGIQVDRVVDVVDILHSSLYPPPATLPDHLRPLVLSLFTFAGQPVALLDLERLFADYRQGLG